MTIAELPYEQIRHFCRLETMIEHRDKWKLYDEDVAAIKWAIDRILTGGSNEKTRKRNKD